MNKKALYPIMAFVLVFAAACGGGKDSSGDSSVKGEDPNATYHRIVEKTDEKIWSAKEQVVVLPDNCDELTEQAGLEFIRLFEEATEISADIEYEAEATVNADGYYYFIGETAALSDNKIDNSYALLGDSGVVIQTRDNVVYMTGATGKGTIYSVYEYMNRAFGYEFYASDETFIGDGTDANWLKFDYVYRPSVANPCMMAGELNADEDLYYKYRFQNYYQTWMAKNSDVYYAHTYFKILPKTEYQGEHSDWYSPDGQNLCLTRDPAMIDEFVERCKEVIEADDTHTYFMLGQEDNFGFCNCSSCTQRIEELGGFSSAVMMEFTNEVVRRMNAWLEETYPERNVTFVTFAYNHTKTAPVTYDEGTKKYIPVSETVIAEKNLSVQYVINMCDYYKPYETDSSIVAALDGWSAVSDNITIWEYSTNFNNYFDCFDNWNSMAENIRLLESHGVDYIVEQAAYNTCTTAFSEMRLYVWSKLMWDSALDTADLVDDFLFSYYKEAAEDVEKYYDAMYAHVDKLVLENGITVRSGGDECMNRKNWPYMKLKELKGYLTDAYASIEPLKASNLLRYNQLYDRIAKQALWVDYYIYTYYPIYLEDADEFYREWKEAALGYGVTMTQEGAYI